MGKLLTTLSKMGIQIPLFRKAQNYQLKQCLYPGSGISRSFTMGGRLKISKHISAWHAQAPTSHIAFAAACPCSPPLRSAESNLLPVCFTRKLECSTCTGSPNMCALFPLFPLKFDIKQSRKSNGRVLEENVTIANLLSLPTRARKESAMYLLT